MTLFIISMILLLLVTVVSLHISYHAECGLIRQPLPAYTPFIPAPRHPAIDLAYTANFYEAARAARNTLTIEQFFMLAFDKEPSATPASFSALTAKQISTIRGKTHKHYNKFYYIRESIRGYAARRG